MKRAGVALLVSVAVAQAGNLTITFPGYDRDETLTNFPALVVFENDVDGFSYDGFASSLGHDLRFSNNTETVELEYEIESWDPNGKSYVWVKVPQFSSNCTIRAYWGTPGAEQPAYCTSGAVWSSAYRAVWHLAPGLKDSTAGQAHALPNSTAVDTEGPVGRARETGLGKQINLGSPTSVNVTSNFTFSFWARTDAAASRKMYVYRWLDKSTYKNYAILCGFAANAIELYSGHSGITGTDPRPFSKISVPDTSWHHYAYTYDGVTFSKYRDGVTIGATNISFAMIGTPNTDVILGNSGAQDPFYGKLDEFRIADQARSANWIYASHLNQRLAMRRSTTVSFPEYDKNEVLTNFPALVVLSEKTPGFSYEFFQSLDGHDLRFTDVSGTTALNHEIESWNPSGNSYVWVQVPEFSANCTIRASWGNVLDMDSPACTTNGATWSDNFRGVWHCNPVKADSSPYAAKTTSVLTGDYLRGAVGNHAVRCGLTSARLLVTETNQLSVSDNFTYSFWAKTSSPDKHYVFFAVPQGGNQLAIIYGYEPKSFEFYSYNGVTGANPQPGSKIAAPDDDWHHYAYTYDGSNWAGYRDGAQIFNVQRIFALKPIVAGNEAFKIGGGHSDGAQFNGGLDEFRVEAQGRSADWIYACYRNQQVRRDGIDYLNTPTFRNRGEVSALRPTSATVACVLSCRLPCAVTLCYGTDDAGEDTSGWDGVMALGTLESGSVGADLTGLQPDRNYVYRLFAENGSGSAWSEPFTFHTAPDLTQYVYKMPFTFSGYTADETLTNFPALVVLSERLNGFSYSQFVSADGGDLRFADDTGAPLDHEVEVWEPEGDSYVWVRIPQLTSGMKIWAYWRNKGIFDAPVYTGNGAVWDADFCGVFHLSPALEDSTLNANPIADSATTNAAGAVSLARGFNGNAFLTAQTSESLSVSEAFTFSFWMKTSSTAQMYLYGRDPGTGDRQHAIVFDVALQKLRFHIEGHFGVLANTYTTIDVPDEEWHQYVYSFDGASWSTYRDGAQLNAQACRLALPLTDDLYVNRCRFGASQGSATSRFDGSLDEFRIERTGRSANWVSANYLTQVSPEIFYTCGGVRAKGTLLTVR